MMVKKSIKLAWRCYCDITRPGDCLILTGNIPELGYWEIGKGIELFGFCFPIWTATIEINIDLESTLSLEYKFIVIKCQENQCVIWEPISGNHLYSLKTDSDDKSDYNFYFENTWGNINEDVVTFDTAPVNPCVFNSRISDYGSDLNLKTSYSQSQVHEKPFRSYSSQGCDNKMNLFSQSETQVNKDNQNELDKPINSKIISLTDVINPKKSNESEKIVIDRNNLIFNNTDSLNGRYDTICTIGKGTWGEVYLVHDIVLGIKRAAKRIPKFFVEDAERFQLEIEIMKNVDHPNIIRLFESFEDANDIYLIMNYCAGGELFDRLVDGPNFDESLAAHIMRQILLAVAYCHNRNIVHRDLKPENFLFLHNNPWSTVKLIDFGLAAIIRENALLYTKAGTPYYVAPEVLGNGYGKECDVWSTGIIMYILLCGFPPFNSATDSGIIKKIKECKIDYTIPEFSEISSDGRNLLKKLLDPSPQSRLTADQALKHPWFHLCKNSSIMNLYQNNLGSDIIQKFRRFQRLNRLKKIALTIMAQHIDEDLIISLKELFTKLDKTGNGVLSVNEIREGILQLGLNRVPADLDAILRDINTSGTGFVDYTEFIAASLSHTQYRQREMCKKVFNIFDLNRDGKISADEIEHVFALAEGNGSKNSDSNVEKKFVDMDEIYKAIKEADVDNDGQISFTEFVEMIRRIPSRVLTGCSDENSNMRIRLSSRPNLCRKDSKPVKRYTSFC